jgi:hypothetical protein
MPRRPKPAAAPADRHGLRQGRRAGERCASGAECPAGPQRPAMRKGASSSRPPDAGAGEGERHSREGLPLLSGPCQGDQGLADRAERRSVRSRRSVGGSARSSSRTGGNSRARSPLWCRDMARPRRHRGSAMVPAARREASPCQARDSKTRGVARASLGRAMQGADDRQVIAAKAALPGWRNDVEGLASRMQNIALSHIVVIVRLNISVRTLVIRYNLVFNLIYYLIRLFFLRHSVSYNTAHCHPGAA